MNTKTSVSQPFQTTFILTKPSSSKTNCHICNKIFSTPGNLRNHVITIHENKREYKCPFKGCTKKYSIQSRLYVHLRTHDGCKPYVCGSCGKSFNEKGNLKTHEKFHSPTRPYQCPHCDKTYKTNGHLKDHIEIQHWNLRKYNCSFCEKSFGRISTLKAHVRTHTGEKEYQCKVEGCSKCFAEKGNMEIHYKRHVRRINKKKEQQELNWKTGSNKKIQSDKNMVTLNAITRPSSNLTLPNSGSLFNLNNLYKAELALTQPFNNSTIYPYSNNNLAFNNTNKILFDDEKNDFCFNPGNSDFLFYDPANEEDHEDREDHVMRDDLNYLNALPELNFGMEQTFWNDF